LVAHLTGGQGVAGSNPVSPTVKALVGVISLQGFSVTQSGNPLRSPSSVGGRSYRRCVGEIENDLSDATASPNRYSAALTTMGMAALGLVPVVGGAVQTIAQGTLGQRQAEREAEFAQRVARRLQALENGPSPKQVLDSDEFIAAWTKAERVAAETADAAKRERLARVLARTGPWGPYDPEDRQILLELVTRYTEEHVALLDFFQDPIAAIHRREPGWKSTYYIAAPMRLVRDFLFPGNAAAMERVPRVSADLERDGTASLALLTNMSADGMLLKRTGYLGDRLLSSLAE
jgi:hypothetical protein